MVYRDPDYMKKWRARNKEKTREYNAQNYKARAADPAFREEKRRQAAQAYHADPVAGRQIRRTHYRKNRDQILARQKAAYLPAARRAELLKKYGLTPEQYDQLLCSQEGRCAICRSDSPGGNMTVFPVDHDHETGRVRGLLCNRCNRALGLLRDDPALLRAATAYLEKPHL